MVPGGTSFGNLDLQNPNQVHHHYQQQSPLSLHQLHHFHQRQQPPPPPVPQPTIHENFPLTIRTVNESEPSVSLADYTKGGKNTTSDEDDDDRGKRISPWHRVKWTDAMVRILITAVSYIGEEADFGGSRRKYANLQKKGKWKSVSKVMTERGYSVSPQQCEDKFNDLNKRYKRLNEILGRGTSCEVVENPSLLDVMDISEKSKEEVRKILSSKHLYYEEMCSYHNGNRLHLPPDPKLQHSLRLALRSRDNCDDNDQEAETDGQDEFENNYAKKMKQCKGIEDFNFGNNVDVNKEGLLNQQWIKERWIQLEEQRLQIQGEMLELEKEKYKWERFCKKRDRELDIMRMENERMKLENEHLAIELKRKEIGLADNS